MKTHNELIKLYDDLRLNKLKWFTFINAKRANKNLVLLLGEINKKGIRKISTPNKKYEKLLSKNFIT